MSEKLDLSLTYDSLLTNKTNNPLSVGDAGSYTVKNANLKFDLSSDFNYYFDQATKNTTTGVSNVFNSLNGKKLLDYKITGTDGLINFFTGTSYDPFVSPTDPYYKTSIASGSAFSTFDGMFYRNLNTYNQTISSLYSFNNYYSSQNFTSYYVNNFQSVGNFTASPDGSMIVETTTLVNNEAKISIPTNSYNIQFFFAQDYNFSLNPYDQNAPYYYYGYVNQNYTDNSFYLSSSNYYQSNSTPLKIVIAYQPSSSLYSINGKIVLMNNVANLNGIYSYDYYYPGPTNLIGQASINGNVITISNYPGYQQVYLTYLKDAWDGRNVYAKQIDYNSQLQLLQMLQVFTPITPARTQDFFITQNNDAALNALSQNDLSSLLQYLQNSMNTQLKNSVLFDDLSIDGGLHFSFLTNSQNDKTSMMNATLSVKVPLKAEGSDSPIKINLNVSLDGSLGVWTTWKSTGILKEMGINLHVKIKTTPADQSVTSSSSTSLSKSATTTTVKTSDGFALQSSILLISLIALPVVYRRRRSNK